MEVDYKGTEIAVIGLSGRFPGADNVEEFWENILHKEVSTSVFTDQDLRESGIKEAVYKNVNYVKKKPVIEKADQFDRGLFGYAKWEADIMDPQVKVFHECVYHALEDAAYDPESYQGKIGLYAGASPDAGWTKHCIENDYLDGLDTEVLSCKDFMSPLISYKLNLTGPSISIYTACSTSLTAVHLACQGLLLGDCNIAVAGGVTVNYPQKAGYMYAKDSIYSEAGVCRPFDEQADGTIFGDGAGAVVLKILEEAKTDKDHIYAVIRSSACNNDGRRKAGFVAPSVVGQQEVIKTAYAMAGVKGDTIDFVEAHGTGTNIGDPIEMEALGQVFAGCTEKSCAVGSVKSNVGHLHAAAGVTSLIKAVKSLEQKIFPATAGFISLNKKIPSENMPFYFNQTAQELSGKARLLRAGVSSFGIGGTNVHILLEEYVDTEMKETSFHGSGLFLISAKNEDALNDLSRSYMDYLDKNQPAPKDLSYTLLSGRKRYSLKRIFSYKDIPQLQATLRKMIDENKYYQVNHNYGKAVVFLFSGQGEQYWGLGKHYYDKVPFFRGEIDRLSVEIQKHMELDIHRLIEDESDQEILDTYMIQPLLFALEYAMARTWMHFGIHPEIMAGHSLGELVAAAVAGVFTEEEAVKIIVYRGKYMQETRMGAMLAVDMNQKKTEQYLPEGVSIAAVNRPDTCILSGARAQIEEVQRILEPLGVKCSWLKVNQGFHSALMDSAAPKFEQLLKQVQIKSPKIPFYSCSMGRVIKDEEACSPAYWSDQLRKPVLFQQIAEDLSSRGYKIFLEAGPGAVLETFVKAIAGKKAVYLKSFAGRRDENKEQDFILNNMAALENLGIRPDWENYYQGLSCKKISLPLYPCQRPDGIKVEKQVLTIQNSGGDGESEERSLQTKTELLLCGLVEELMDCGALEVSGDLLEAGAHSLVLTRLLSRVEDIYKADINLEELMVEPTIEHVVALLTKHWGDMETLETITEAYIEYKERERKEIE